MRIIDRIAADMTVRLRRVLIQPVFGNQKVVIKFRFLASCRRPPIVSPFDDRRHGQQDGFRAAIGLQAKQRASVIDEIKLDIATSTIGLKVAFSLAIRRVFAALYDRQIGIDESISNALHHGEALFESELMEVIEEDTADTARLFSVSQVEIVVTLLLEIRIELFAVGVEGITTGAVEMDHVLFEAIIGRQVHTSSKPPDVRFLTSVRCLGDKEADIHMHCRDIGVPRMEHQRDSHSLPSATCGLRVCGAGRRRQFVAHDMREADTGSFENIAFFQHA